MTNVTGTTNDDLLYGSYGADLIIALAGNDTIFAYKSWGVGSEDTIDAGDGDDIIHASNLASLSGGSGTDTLYLHGYSGMSTSLPGSLSDCGIEIFHGGNGDDAAYGGATSTALLMTGGAGSDVLVGGSGNDTIRGGSGDDSYLAGRDGDDTIYGEDGDDQLIGDAGNDLLHGGQGNDNLLGGDGADKLLGKSGNDFLDGGNGDDLLGGEDGDDLLWGGAGRDVMAGGTGADQFHFADGDFVGATRAVAERIVDFSQAEHDVISLRDIDAVAGSLTDEAFTFIGAGAFTKVAGQLHYAKVGTNTFVEGDTDGDGAADFAIRLTGLHDLVAADFVL